jgi:hypothetical protein
MNNGVLETTGNKLSATTIDKVSVARPIIKIAKFVSLGALTLVAILLIAHMAWNRSGSNQWELEIDKDGVKVYSLKSPGSSLKQFKMVTRIKTTLNRVVASLTDSDLENCKEWYKERCVGVQSVVPWNQKGQHYVTLFRVNYPSPFSPRDILTKGQFTQDPKSKAVFVEFTAAPDMLPKNDCCFRIVHMSNTWRLTPLENGEIEVENTHNTDFGLPYILYNRRMPDALYNVGINLPKFFNKEKYNNASFDFIK